MAAMGMDSAVSDEADSDTNATVNADDDVEDSDESSEDAEEPTNEDTESEDEEEAEEVEAKGNEEEDSPFTAEDRKALKTAPKEVQKLAKSLQKDYTRKTQELAETRKFQQMLQGDPRTVLQRVAEANGLKVTIDDGKTAPAAKAPESLSTDAVESVIAEEVARLAPIIGEEAAKTLLRSHDRVAQARANAAVAPIVAGNTAREQAALQERVNAEFNRFASEHPDWKAHEVTMLEKMKALNPNLSTYEMSKLAYELATAGTKVVKAATEAEAKLAAKKKRAMADAEPAPRTRVPGTKVKEAPKRYAKTEDAVKAALAEMGYTE